MNDYNVTIVVTRHNEPDWLVEKMLQSLSVQKNITAEILFFDHIFSKNIEDMCIKLSTDQLFFSYRPIKKMPTSQARNLMLESVQTRYFLMLDADEIVDDQWASALLSVLQTTDASIVGGPYQLLWHRKPPFFMRATRIAMQYSNFYLPPGTYEVDYVATGNFGLDMTRVPKSLKFRENLGHHGKKTLGTEDTVFCLDAKKIGLKVYYTDRARIFHYVLPSRMNYQFIAKKLFYTGYASIFFQGSKNSIYRIKRNIWDFIFYPFIYGPLFIGRMWGRIVKFRG